jgi:hypothetical protein
MSIQFSVDTKALQVTATSRDPATIINGSGGTLYYKNASDVDTGDSSLANDASVEVTAQNWVVAATGAPVKVIVLRNKDREDQDFPESREQIRTVDGPVQSGTAAISGTLAGIAETDTVVFDKTTKSMFVNEGTAASPYWTPISVGANMTGVLDDMNALNVSTAIAGTYGLTPAGIRVFGQGAAENDSGLIPTTAVEGGSVGLSTTTNEDAHLHALGSPAGIFQPDTHGTCVVDVEWTAVTNITTRAGFVGFSGAAADALDPLMTYSSTTASFTADDLVGATFSSELTDADRWYTVSEKSNLAATQALGTTGNTSVDYPAAATYQRVRVEVRTDGTAYVWFDKTLFATVIAGASGGGAHASAISYDVDEEFSPVAYIESSAASIRSTNIKRFMYWGVRS